MMPNGALTRTSSPETSDSPIKRCPYSTRNVSTGMIDGAVNGA
jgi:hypothetical protein